MNTTTSDVKKGKSSHLILQIFKWLLLGTVLLGFLLYRFQAPKLLRNSLINWNDSIISDQKVRFQKLEILDQSTGMLNLLNQNREETFPNETKMPVNLGPCLNIYFEVNETAKEKCLVYNMVPKCGSAGTRNLIFALKQRLNYSCENGNYDIVGRIQRHQHSFKNTKILVTDMEQRCKKSVRNFLYYRHQYFEPFSLLGADYNTPSHFNLIRDPVDHYISWYYFRRFARHGKGANGLIPIGKSKVIQKNMTFNECVLTNHIECASSLFTNTIVPYFCGNDDVCLEPSINSLNRAKRNVVKYFKVIGYLENYTQFLELSEFIWPQFFKGVVMLHLEKEKVKIKPVNINAERHKYEPSEKVKAIMKTRIPIDYMFYHWIKQRFHCMYNRYIVLDQ